MTQYERIDISEGIDFIKTSKSVEYMICHYWYFKGVGFKYQPYVCNGCHDFSMIIQNLSDIIKEGAYCGTYFRDIYSGVNSKFYKDSWKEFKELKNIDKKYYSSDYYDVSVNKYGVKCGTSLRFWENKGWINPIDLYGWFQWYFRYYLGRRSEDDKRKIKRWKGIANRFKSILIKMIKDKGSKFDDYNISPKIRQILLPWGYESKESNIQ